MILEQNTIIKNLEQALKDGKEISKQSIEELLLEHKKTLKKFDKVTKIHDITELKIKQTNENFKILFDTSIEAMLIIEQNKVIQTNKQSLKLFEATSLKDKDIKKLISKESIGKLNECIKSSNNTIYEYDIIKSSKLSSPALIKVDNIMLKNKECQILNIIDISQMRNKDKLLLKQAKLAQIGEMTTSITKELVNPIEQISIITKDIINNRINNSFDKDTEVANIIKLDEIKEELDNSLNSLYDLSVEFKSKYNHSHLNILEIIEYSLLNYKTKLQQNDIEVITRIEENIKLCDNKNDIEEILLILIKNSIEEFKLKKGNTKKVIVIEVKMIKQNIIISFKNSAGGKDKNFLNNIHNTIFDADFNSYELELYKIYRKLQYGNIQDITIENGSFEIENETYQGVIFDIVLVSSVKYNSIIGNYELAGEIKNYLENDIQIPNNLSNELLTQYLNLDRRFNKILKVSDKQQFQIMKLFDKQTIQNEDIQKKDKLLYEQSKMAFLGEMINNIAHQWRQPLGAILASMSGLEFKKSQGILTDDDFYKSVKNINESTQYLSKTIDDFRDFMNDKKSESSFVFDDIISSIKSILDPILQKEEINCNTNIEYDSIVMSSKNEFIQVFINIINNSIDALKYLDDNIPRIINIDVKKIENTLVCTISDNAGGIEEKLKERIFEPYFTTKHKTQGTGLGLYIVYKIVIEKLNGKIKFENQDLEYQNKRYKGACFTFDIPISQDD
jgi:signal transduction histidine kinase